MRIKALAVDYDGTIAHGGEVAQETYAALNALRESGRRLLLVTGRTVEDLQAIDVDLTCFDLVVGENGGVLFEPNSRTLTALGEAAPASLVDALKRKKVPFNQGHLVVATVEPHQTEVLNTVRELGLEWQVIFNKGSVMALPAGVTKASGLLTALDQLHLSPHNAAGIGDAENDHSFLSLCEVSVAVANALPALKDRADIVLRRRNGSGVSEFVRRDLLDDLRAHNAVFQRHNFTLGTTRRGTPVTMPVYGANCLIVGSSCSGKSTLSGALVERLADLGYQVCIIDPEGDHAGIDPLITLGSPEARPTMEEIETALDRTAAGVSINLVSMNLADKVRFSSALVAGIVKIQGSRGRPHWILIDEAHHLLPASGTPATSVLPDDWERVAMVTLDAEMLSRDALARITHLLVVGADAGRHVRRFARARGLEPPALGDGLDHLLEGEALLVTVRGDRLSRPRRFYVAPQRTEHRRHVRKYAGGDLGPHYSFYFRGPLAALNLRAFNVTMFVEMARGVDEATWQFHLERGDISAWFRKHVKDPELASQIEAVEAKSAKLTPERSRSLVLDLIEPQHVSA